MNVTWGWGGGGNILFECPRVEHIRKDSKNLINNQSISDMFRVQAYESIMFEYFWTEFIHFVE